MNARLHGISLHFILFSLFLSPNHNFIGLIQNHLLFPFGINIFDSTLNFTMPPKRASRQSRGSRGGTPQNPTLPIGRGRGDPGQSGGQPDPNIDPALQQQQTVSNLHHLVAPTNR